MYGGADVCAYTVFMDEGVGFTFSGHADSDWSIAGCLCGRMDKFD